MGVKLGFSLWGCSGIWPWGR